MCRNFLHHHHRPSIKLIPPISFFPCLSTLLLSKPLQQSTDKISALISFVFLFVGLSGVRKVKSAIFYAPKNKNNNRRAATPHTEFIEFDSFLFFFFFFFSLRPFGFGLEVPETRISAYRARFEEALIVRGVACV